MRFMRIRHRRYAFLLACIAPLLLSVPIQSAWAQTRSSRTVAELISDLSQIDARSPGIDSAGMYEGFIADGTPGRFEEGVLGPRAPHVPYAMRELVRRGPAALPELIKHLDDDRPTKLMVGNDPGSHSKRSVGVNLFMFTYFSDEYDPRVRPPFSEEPWKDGPKPMEKHFEGRYTVKVGDVCFALIGQIVNRRLFAVRYQPSGGMIVNSPIEAPVLATKVRRDWGSGDAGLLRTSLLSDIRAARGAKLNDEGWYLMAPAHGAFQRLRLYFPEEYEKLDSRDRQTEVRFKTEFKSND
ncbi:MAG TPA: hypothetical protein VMD29_17305 [Terracidiphilus sp.]|nr:hypothetical protein [Terracidiphilus sp.]